MKDGKKDWRKKAREYLAISFGGKCTICDYDKTIAALDYHHVDPKHKSVELSKAMRNGSAWSKIVEEARKCTIVCCRCHRELHAGVVELPENYAKFNEEYVDVIKLKFKEFDECPCCGEEKPKKQKFCSLECFSKHSRVFEVSKEELEQLVKDHPYERIGEMFGVTGNAIKKRCKKLEIALLPKRGGYWRYRELNISKEELKELLNTKSINAISIHFKTSHKVIKKLVQDYEIEIPKINWNKISGQARWQV